MTLNEKRIERRKIWEKMKALNDKALAEKRDLSAEEQTQWTAMEADVDKMGKEVEAEETRQRKAKEIEDSFQTTATPIVPPIETNSDPLNNTEYRKALRSYLIRGEHIGAAEARTLQVDQDTAGGYLVPITVSNEILTLMRNRFLVRSIARVLPPLPRGSSIQAPSMDSELGDLTFTAELLTGSVDTTRPFGKRMLSPKPMARVAKISKTLVAAPGADVEGLVKDSLSYKAGAVEENAFLNGSGSNEPLGVFTALSGQGITTTRDVSTGNTDTEIKFDGLLSVYHSLHEGYRMNATWAFHDDAILAIRKLKDGEGRYIWQPSMVAGQPDTLLARPVRTSAYAPHTFTTGLYVGIFGDFSRYWIADALGTTIQTLAELYALTNENGYIIRKEVDGMPVLEEAFSRVKLA